MHVFSESTLELETWIRSEVEFERELRQGDTGTAVKRVQEWLNLHGRLSDGVGIAQASAAVARITSQLAKEYPATNKFKAGIVVAYDPMGFDRSQLRRIQALALTLTGAVLFVLCLNLSGMVLVRSAMRERELSIRQAIGASRARLLRRSPCALREE